MDKTVYMEYRTLPPKILVVSDDHIRQIPLSSRMTVGRATAAQSVDIDLAKSFVSALFD